MGLLSTLVGLFLSFLGHEFQIEYMSLVTVVFRSSEGVW